MIKKENIAEALNDLVAIHNDRIEGYQLALNELDDSDEDLKQLFLMQIKQSHAIKMYLGNEVQVEGESIADSTTMSGKIYHTWMDFKAAFTWQDRRSILASCEFGEDAVQKAYSEALEEELPAHIRMMLIDQQAELRISHNKIKLIRDATL